MMPLLLLSAALAAEEKGTAVIKEDISVRARGAGPALPLPAPKADRAVVDEVVGSLKIMRKEHAVSASDVDMPGSEKLSQPFPGSPYLTFWPRSVTTPYDLWTFEVVDGAGQTLWRQDGTGRVVEPLEWDGGGPSGEDAVRVGGSYHLRFTGRHGAETFTVATKPAALKSLATREFLGGTRLEVGNDELFESGAARFKAGADKYLRVMADRLRRLPPKGGYRLELRGPKPEGETARRRADALRKWFADQLVINAALVRVETAALGERGDVTACLLPADKGDAFHQE